MSWEVSTMPSKRSFCSATLLKKNLSRFWPLWGGASLVGFLIPLWLLLSLLSYGHQNAEAADFAISCYTAVTAIVPGVTFCYAILCAMAVWSYLYSARSVGLFHALPMDRTCLFVTNTLSGLAMMLIPYVTTGLPVCLIALGWGFLDLGAALETAALVILMTLTFFGVATFCAMITGNIFALPAFYLVLNFAFPALELMVTGFAQQFLVGLAGASTGALDFLSPVMMLYGRLNAYYMDDVPVLEGAPTAAVYGLVGIALLVVSWGLYRLRRSESAGDVVAFRWLRPVFRYGLALAFALTLGWLLYQIIWYTIFQTGEYADFIPMAVCLAFAGVVGYYVASMLLEKTLRVFRRSWPGVLTVCAGAVILCGCVRFDVLGMESRLPRQEDVAWMTMSIGGQDITVDASQPGDLTRVLEIHRSIAADADYIREVEGRAENRLPTRYLYLRYYDARGDQLLYRRYDLPVDEARLTSPGTYEYLLESFLTDPEVRLSQVTLPQGSEIVDMELTDYISGESMVCDPEYFETIYQAYLQDAREGNLPGFEGLLPEDDGYSYYPGDLTIRAVSRQEDSAVDRGEGTLSADSSGSNRYVELTPRMTHTIEALREAELLTQETLDAWNEELGLAVPATVDHS